jgi:uridine phosphorylase
MRTIAASELVLNDKGGVYHLNLKPEHIATTVIFVGDQDRVPKVAKHFDSIEYETQKREFRTITGTYKGKRMSVISTGIGPDNIDIVMNELDALVNIDLEKRVIKEKLISLNIVRIGTSGSLQKDIPVDHFVLAEMGLGLDGMLWSYNCKNILEHDIADAFVKHTNWMPEKAKPYFVKNSEELGSILAGGKKVHKGITATAGGFFGPQGRILRLPIQDPDLNDKIDDFEYQGHRITNLEMETSAIYGLSKLMGHKACSMNCIIANRANKTFSKDYQAGVEELIIYTLEKLAQI